MKGRWMKVSDHAGETYRELLKDTVEAIQVAQGLMRSEDERHKIIGLNLFLDLSDQAIVLTDILGGATGDDVNPLARRVRLRRGDIEP